MNIHFASYISGPVTEQTLIINAQSSGRAPSSEMGTNPPLAGGYVPRTRLAYLYGEINK